MADARHLIHGPSYQPKPGATDTEWDPSTLELLDNYVLLARDSEETMTEGGLHKPLSAIELKHTGVIRALGTGCREDVQLSQRVLFGKYSGVELTFDGAPYAIVRDSDIIAILPEGVRSDRID